MASEHLKFHFFGATFEILQMLPDKNSRSFFKQIGSMGVYNLGWDKLEPICPHPRENAI